MKKQTKEQHKPFKKSLRGKTEEEIMCSYPKCNKQAEVTLGMNDPDAERIPYCEECAEKVKMNTFMEIAKFRSVRKNEKTT